MIHFFMEEGKVYVNNHWRQLASRSWPPSRFSRLSRKTFHLEDDQLCSQCHHRTLPLSRKYQFLPVPLQHSNLLISPHVFDFQVPASLVKGKPAGEPCRVTDTSHGQASGPAVRGTVRQLGLCQAASLLQVWQPHRAAHGGMTKGRGASISPCLWYSCLASFFKPSLRSPWTCSLW